MSKLVEIGVEGAFEGSVLCFGCGICNWELCSPMVALIIHASSFWLFQGNNGCDGMFNYAFIFFLEGIKEVLLTFQFSLRFLFSFSTLSQD